MGYMRAHLPQSTIWQTRSDIILSIYRDTGLSASSEKVHDVEKLTNLDLDKIYNWLLANKLSINVEKI